MITTEEIKDWIVYNMEPDVLCELLGTKTCLELSKSIRADRKALGYADDE